MIFPAFASLLALATTALAASTQRQEPSTMCGSHQTLGAEVEAKIAAESARIANSSDGARRASSFPIAFHVITCNGEGAASVTTLQNQVAWMNKQYSGTGISWTYRSAGELLPSNSSQRTVS